MTTQFSQDCHSDANQISASLRHMSAVMDAYPPAFRGNPLNLLFLDDARPIRHAPEYLRCLDGPALCEEAREYLLGDSPSWPFPIHSVRERPDPWLLSQRLYEQFDAVPNLLPTQRDIGRILSEKASKFEPDVVALMVVDGLSYYDLPDESDLHPCFVNGASITEFGYREVIGKPSVSARLFSLGYRHQLGFTYFDVETNLLASDLYSVFGCNQVTKVRVFEECLERINDERMSRGFVQVTAAGLDHLCHSHRDEPLVQRYIDDHIIAWFDKLVTCLKHGHRRVLACLTADHGILWRHCLEGQWTVVNDLQPDDTRHMRYIPGSRLRHYVHVKNCLGNTYSMLQVPYLTRQLRNNEWGVHGGISAYESLVPLIMRVV